MSQPLPLGLRPDSPLSSDPTFLRKLSELEAESLDFVVQRVMQKQRMSERQAQWARLAFLRFLTLTLINRGGVVPTPLADVFWHEFILFTAAYADFCQKHFGRFIHHQPHTAGGNQGGLSPMASVDMLGDYYGDVTNLKAYIASSERGAA